MPPPSILDLSRDELTHWCVSQEEKPFRADQIRKWIFGKRVASFEVMTDLSAKLRTGLTEQFSLFASTIVAHQIASDRTEKLLLELQDGERIECVLMREEDRRTICISTQVGCGMGCVFCASGMLGLTRNLTCGEILEQVLRLDHLLEKDERITNVVVMGIGEPLANLPNLVKALTSLDEKGGMGLGARRITISTVGLPEKIRDLARLDKQYNLAISLHAPNDSLRNRLVPVNDKIGIEAILAAADDYFAATGRRISFEYVVLNDVNDSLDEAHQLIGLLKGRNAHVNLIPMNSVSELPYHDPRVERLRDFVATLSLGGVTATVRKRKGADIDAACGQLRLRHAVRIEETSAAPAHE